MKVSEEWKAVDNIKSKELTVMKGTQWPTFRRKWNKWGDLVAPTNTPWPPFGRKTNWLSGQFLILMFNYKGGRRRRKKTLHCESHWQCNGRLASFSRLKFKADSLGTTQTTVCFPSSLPTPHNVSTWNNHACSSRRLPVTISALPNLSAIPEIPAMQSGRTGNCSS